MSIINGKELDNRRMKNRKMRTRMKITSKMKKIIDYLQYVYSIHPITQ